MSCQGFALCSSVFTNSTTALAWLCRVVGAWPLTRRLYTECRAISSAEPSDILLAGATAAQIAALLKRCCSEQMSVQLASEGVTCAICLSSFEVGDEMTQLPCAHQYHCNCLSEWLCLSASCPMCKRELPVPRQEADCVVDNCTTLGMASLRPMTSDTGDAQGCPEPRPLESSPSHPDVRYGQMDPATAALQ